MKKIIKMSISFGQMIDEMLKDNSLVGISDKWNIEDVNNLDSYVYVGKNGFLYWKSSAGEHPVQLNMKNDEYNLLTSTWSLVE